MNETELIEYLKEHNLPKNEGTYPKELLTLITIRAFNELAERIQELQDDLNTVEDELSECRRELEDVDGKLAEIN